MSDLKVTVPPSTVVAMDATSNDSSKVLPLTPREPQSDAAVATPFATFTTQLQPAAFGVSVMAEYSSPPMLTESHPLGTPPKVTPSITPFPCPTKGVEALESPREGHQQQSAIPFARGLFQMISDVSVVDPSLISWSPDGSAFRIATNDPHNLQRTISLYFRMRNVASLENRLNEHRFCRLKNGSNKGSWWHPSFHRDMKPSDFASIVRKSCRTNLAKAASSSTSAAETFSEDGMDYDEDSDSSLLLETSCELFSMETLMDDPVIGRIAMESNMFYPILSAGDRFEVGCLANGNAEVLIPTPAKTRTNGLDHASPVPPLKGDPFEQAAATVTSSPHMALSHYSHVFESEHAAGFSPPRLDGMMGSDKMSSFFAVTPRKLSLDAAEEHSSRRRSKRLNSNDEKQLPVRVVSFNPRNVEPMQIDCLHASV